MAKLRLVLAAGLAIASAPIAQAKIVKGGAKTTVVFKATGSAGMTIVGITSALVLRDDGRTLFLSVPLETVTTGLTLRDKHMRQKYLQVGQYPSAELSVDRTVLKTPGASAITADAKGLMKLHGKSKLITFRYSARKNGQAIEVTGSTRLDIRDFGIEVPSFLGVSVKPNVDIAITFDAKDI